MLAVCETANGPSKQTVGGQIPPGTPDNGTLSLRGGVRSWGRPARLRSDDVEVTGQAALFISSYVS